MPPDSSEPGSTPRPYTRGELAALIAITAIGVAVRIRFLDRTMQLDEAYSFNEYASKPLIDGLSWYTLPNNHLLNTLLVHVSTALLGNSPWTVRLPAFVAGVLLIPATYWMTIMLVGRLPAAFAMALVASSEPLVNYSSNSRGYTLVALFTVLLVVLAKRIMTNGGRPRDWAGFTLLPALGLFAIPTMLYPYGGVVLWLILASRWPASGRNHPVRLDRLFSSGFASVGLAALLYLPAILRVGLKRVIENPYVAPRPIGEVLRELPGSLVATWVQWNLDVPRVVSALFVLAWSWSVARLVLARRGIGTPTSLSLTVLAWSLALALAQRVVPYDRVWTFAIPLYAACVGEGLARAFERIPFGPTGIWPRLGPALAVLLGLGLSWPVARGDTLDTESCFYTMNHAEEIVRFLKPTLRPGDGVLVLSPCDAPLKYEFLRRRVPVEHFYDYTITRANRLYVAVDRPNHQDLSMVLAGFKVPLSAYTVPRVVRDFGESAIYELQRR
jgi:hypothetical protein